MGARKRNSAEMMKDAREMVAFAKLNNCPTSPRKMRLVAGLVRGVEVEKALHILKHSPQAAAPRLHKLLLSAIANWQAKNEGVRIEDANLFVKEVSVKHFAVKESVFPFNRFPGVDAVLGPEMKSTGEVIGIDRTFEMAYAKSQLAAGQRLPLSGTIFVSVKDKDKPSIYPIVKEFEKLGFKIYASSGTGKFLQSKGINVKIIPKVYEGRPNVVDYMKNNEISLIINTPSGKKPRKDIVSIRTIAVNRGVPLVTTVPGAKATLLAIKKLIESKIEVCSLQEYHQALKNS